MDKYLEGIKKDVKIIESIWDIIMKNTNYKNIDFTKFESRLLIMTKNRLN